MDIYTLPDYSYDFRIVSKNPEMDLVEYESISGRTKVVVENVKGVTVAFFSWEGGEKKYVVNSPYELGRIFYLYANFGNKVNPSILGDFNPIVDSKRDFSSVLKYLVNEKRFKLIECEEFEASISPKHDHNVEFFVKVDVENGSIRFQEKSKGVVMRDWVSYNLSVKSIVNAIIAMAESSIALSAAALG